MRVHETRQLTKLAKVVLVMTFVWFGVVGVTIWRSYVTWAADGSSTVIAFPQYVEVTAEIIVTVIMFACLVVQWHHHWTAGWCVRELRPVAHTNV